MQNQTMKSQIDELLAEWPAEWKRERLNVLVRKSRRAYDHEPAVTVALRYKHTEIASTNAPLAVRYDATAQNRVGVLGARSSYALQADIAAIIREAELALGQSLDLQINCPDSIIN